LCDYFSDVHWHNLINKKYLESIWNKQVTIPFEAVDIFEFDQENKIKNLKIILDTYPIRKLKEKSAIVD